MRAILYIVIVGLLAVAFEAYTNDVYRSGIHAESTRRDGIDAFKTLTAEREQARLNTQVRVLQAQLGTAVLERDTLRTELNHEQTISTKRAADLAAGVTRERVLIRAISTTDRAPAANGPAECSAARSVGDGAAVEADLDPGVASWLEGIRGRYNAAAARLGACVQAYGAVKAAADAMP
jgi:hypothetical protein